MFSIQFITHMAFRNKTFSHSFEFLSWRTSFVIHISITSMAQMFPGGPVSSQIICTEKVHRLIIARWYLLIYGNLYFNTTFLYIQVTGRTLTKSENECTKQLLSHEETTWHYSFFSRSEFSAFPYFQPL